MFMLDSFIEVSNAQRLEEGKVVDLVIIAAWLLIVYLRLLDHLRLLLL